VAPLPSAPWRFQFSSTLKSIYVIRYLLFSGGAAIAVAMVQRLASGSERTGLGLLAGLAVGLVLFRSQLRPLSLPVLALGQEHLFFVRKGKAIALPWPAIRAVTERGKHVAVQLAATATRPDGTAGDAFELRGSDFGLTAPQLAQLLQGYREPLARSPLPTDAELRQAMGFTT
jgi:hypothetical protein